MRNTLAPRAPHSFPLVPVALLALLFLSCSSLWAQNLGWEGETGVFVTPLAYTAGVEGKVAEPVIGFHFFDAGPVIGQFYQASITVGLGSRFEMGYTGDMHAQSGKADLSPLWDSGFDTFHGKAQIIKEKLQRQAVGAGNVGGIHGAHQCQERRRRPHG